LQNCWRSDEAALRVWQGMLDTLDDVFWMLPFSSKKQAHIIRQENQITDLL
jgi:hypothetical protein